MEVSDKSEKSERKYTKTIKDVFVGLIFFFLMFLMSCINMLLLMNFNGWVIICIVIGACLGYFLGEVLNLKKAHVSKY